jgi:spore coat protein CotH
MKGRRITGFVLICVFLATAREYSGVVVDNGTGSPVKGVLVSVGHSEYYARTDQDGKFVITTPTTKVLERWAPKAGPMAARWNFRGRTLDLSAAPEVTSASVYAINGKRVFSGRVTPSRVIGVPPLAAGAYLLELRGERGALGSARVLLSNRAAASFTFNLAPAEDADRRTAKSAQTAAVSELLIFRHDSYYPKDSALTGSGTGMRIALKPDERSYPFNRSIIREYRFTIDKNDSAKLDTYGYREEFVPAVLSFDGVDRGKVGLRYKGSGYTLPRCFFQANWTGQVDTTGTPKKTCDKISYKIKFTEYDEEKRFYGMKKINLHAMSADGTKMHDVLSYELFRDMGIPAPRTAYANVYVNGKLIGLFLAVEEIDGRFTKSRWPEYGDGNLYKEVWPKSTDKNYYLNGLKTNDEPIANANVQKMISYYNAINSSNEQNFAQNLSSYMDFDYFLRYMAVDVAIKNWDGIRSWYIDQTTGQASNHNYFFYEEENAGGKIWIVPWDMDQALGQRDTYFDAGGGGWGGGGGQPLPQWNVPTTNCGSQSVGGNNFIPPNCDKLTKLTAAVYGNRYVQFGDLFLNELFVSQRLNEKINELSNVISGAVQQDPVINQGTWTNDVNSLKNYLPNNISSFRNHIHP